MRTHLQPVVVRQASRMLGPLAYTLYILDAVPSIHVIASNLATEASHKNGGMFTNRAD